MWVQDKKDRRIFERFEAQLPAKFEEPVGADEVPVLLKDVSPDGLKFTTTQRVDLNDFVTLQVDLPQSPVSLKGRVVWTKMLNTSLRDVGLQFENADFIKVKPIYELVVSA